MGKKIKERIQKDYYHYPVFCKVHVFYISSPKTSVRNGSTVKYDSRIIEPNIWKDYQPSKYYEGCTIAHHWKFINKCKSEDNSELSPKDSKSNNAKPLYNVNLFFTAKYPKVVYATLIAYFAIIVLLGALGSWLADFLPPDASADDGQSGIGWDWNLKTYILIILLGWIVIHWIIKHIRILFKVVFRFD